VHKIIPTPCLDDLVSEMYISCIESGCEGAISALRIVDGHQAHINAYLRGFQIDGWSIGVIKLPQQALPGSFEEDGHSPAQISTSSPKVSMLSSLRAARALPRRKVSPLALSSNSLCVPTPTWTKVYVRRRYAAASTSASAESDKGSAPRLSGDPSIFLPD
jgi:hypothetical protein